MNRVYLYVCVIIILIYVGNESGISLRTCYYNIKIGGFTDIEAALVAAGDRIDIKVNFTAKTSVLDDDKAHHRNSTRNSRTAAWSQYFNSGWRVPTADFLHHVSNDRALHILFKPRKSITHLTLDVWYIQYYISRDVVCMVYAILHHHSG